MKLLTTKFAFACIYILFTVLLISGVSVKYAYSQDSNVCDGLTGAAYGLCNAYCNAMDCANPNHKASDRACDRVQSNFEKITGEHPPCSCENVTCYNGESCVDGECQCGGSQCGQYEDCISNECVDPCADLASRAECPCDFELVPKTTDCWAKCANCVGQPQFAPCAGGDCALNDSNICDLARNDVGHAYGMYVQYAINSQVLSQCVYYPPGESCPALQQIHSSLTAAQEATCYCRLSQYANELSQVDGAIVIESTQSPPYDCGTFTLP